MTGNAENFGISNFTGNNIDTSNTVSGKSVYYLVNKRNIVLDNLTFPQIGYLALVNSANVTVKNLELSNNDDGVKFVNTSNSTIENVEVSSNGDGVDLFNVTNSIIGNVNARNNSDGVYLNGVSDSIIENVNASNNSEGISLEASTSNQIAGNDVLNNWFGIDLDDCTDNVFTGNVIRSSVQYACGVLLESTHSNVFYHNNFKMPTFQPSVYQVRVFNSSESWDNGAEGNYWSDYRTNNPNAKEYMGTGIWDTAYEIVGSTPPQYDRYPLYSQWNSVRLFKVAKTISNALDIYGNYKIVVNSDHVIANLNFTKPPPGHYYPLQLSFNITAGSSGFCNITIPRAWLDGPFSLTINNALPPFLSIKTLNENYTSLYFTYVPGKYQVKIIGTRSATLLSFDVTGTGKINMIDIGLLASLFNAKIDMTCYDVTQYDP
jgi:parallel beta-helix repeat protein